jgi:hypothetical protein
VQAHTDRLGQCLEGTLLEHGLILRSPAKACFVIPGFTRDPRDMDCGSSPQ